ncbi:MAG: alanine racemase [Opitutales bacterium]
MAAPVQDPRPPCHRCWAEIDLDALARNLGGIRSALPADIHYVAVVKADAYGHGLAPVAAALMQAGVDCFAVANVAEAVQLREIGRGFPILVLGPVLPEEERPLVEHRLIGTVSSTEEIERLDRAGRALRTTASVHLKVDTGMGRLGVWHDRAAGLLEALAGRRSLRLEGLYTHFASADSDPAYTTRQRRRLLAVIEALPEERRAGLMIHADNSAGIDSFDSHLPFNAVRVGLLQFGVKPYAGSLLANVRVEPTFTFHARVGLIKTLPAGTPVSYGGTHRLRGDTRVAIITAGYGDGIPLGASNRGAVLIRGRRCPILGRVTMDQTVVGIDTLPDTPPVGETVTLIGRDGGEHLSLDAFAEQGATIPWEVLTSVTKRVPRIYRSGRQT